MGNQTRGAEGATQRGPCYLTATGEMVPLSPMPLAIESLEGRLVARMSGRSDAQMLTASVVNAAKTFFDLPESSAAEPATVGRTTLSRAELSGVLEQKNIAVFSDGDTGLVRILYREMVLRFKPSVSARMRNTIIKRSGLAIRYRHPIIAEQVILYDIDRRFPGEALVDIAVELANLDEIAFATPNFVSQFLRESTSASIRPSSAQWHLKLVNASKAWNTTRGKKAVSIAILDDGVDVEHPELRHNVVRNPDRGELRDVLGRDFFLPDTDPDHFNPRPKHFRAPYHETQGNDIHGTPCAGVAVGRGPRAYGLAPRCGLLPVKIFHADDFAPDAQVADAIRYAALHSDVLSCSWTGPRSPDIEFALIDAMRLGRKGRGSVIVCATGNDSRNKVGFPASHPDTIAVGASTDADDLASYSNWGEEVWVVAPSSGGNRGVFTADVAAKGRGYNIGDAASGGVDGLFTNSFGGTSSATPLVAGLCGLLLSLDSKLTTAGIRTILADSAKKIGRVSAYGSNGHSPKYGYGRIDAAAAVAMAASNRQAPSVVNAAPRKATNQGRRA